MREILFRGKRIDNGEWVFGYYVYSEFNGYNGKSGIAFADTPLGFEVVEVDPETVGQYTGKRDIKGQRIFAGDFIKTKTEKILIRRDVTRFQPYGKNKNGDWAKTTNWGRVASGEICGNIYEVVE